MIAPAIPQPTLNKLRKTSCSDCDQAVQSPSFLESWQVYTSSYMVLNPVAIPPFLRVDLHTVELHGEVNVIASCHSGHAALAHDLAPLDHVAFMHIDMAEMPVDGLQPVAMIDDDAIAVDAKRCRID